jgi:hypothetical protein
VAPRLGLRAAVGEGLTALAYTSSAADAKSIYRV